MHYLDICIWIQNAHTRDHYSPYVIYNTKLYQSKNRIHARVKEDNGSQNKHLAINKAIQRKSQYEDGLQNPPQLLVWLVMDKEYIEIFLGGIKEWCSRPTSQQTSKWQKIEIKMPYFEKRFIGSFNYSNQPTKPWLE